MRQVHLLCTEIMCETRYQNSFARSRPRLMTWLVQNLRGCSKHRNIQYHHLACSLSQRKKCLCVWFLFFVLTQKIRQRSVLPSPFGMSPSVPRHHAVLLAIFIIVYRVSRFCRFRGLLFHFYSNIRPDHPKILNPRYALFQQERGRLSK